MVKPPIVFVAAGLRNTRRFIKSNSWSWLLDNMGQVPFYPPNVGGWPSAQAWLSTAAADARLQAATVLARSADLSTITQTTTSARIDAVGYLLGIGGWSDRSATVLKPDVGNPQQLVAVALNTPEYLVH